MMDDLKITYIGGPTAILEWGGIRMLTDPTFDPPGQYENGPVTLRKLTGPALPMDSVGPIDMVLLSHDHHFENLDRLGRKFLSRAGRVLTTVAGAERLGNKAIGLENWEQFEIHSPDGRMLWISGIPARHGPVGGDRGPVTGFGLCFADNPREVLYVSGDTVWYEELSRLPAHFDIRVAMLFMGAAQVVAGGPHLTMTASEGVKAALAFPDAIIVPLHFEGWAHFTESREMIQSTFVDAGLEHRVLWPESGSTVMPLAA
jgi:L-ascorbate metabolism protein UlaG (beta-lactamase superfamily)